MVSFMCKPQHQAQCLQPAVCSRERIHALSGFPGQFQKGKALAPRSEAPGLKLPRASCPAAATPHYACSERTVSSRSGAYGPQLQHLKLVNALSLAAAHTNSRQGCKHSTHAAAADAPAGPSGPQQQTQQPQQQQQQQQQQQPKQRQQQPQEQQSAADAAGQMLTCRRCFQRFSSAANSSRACSFHPALYTGGEVAKAIGFVRASSAPEHQLGAVVGRTGLMRFWDCCGAADESAPGCVQGFHVSFDDDLNEANGWKE